MSDIMSVNTADRDLIALVESKSPEELSLEEIELLRTRLHSSAELQQYLLQQMQMDSYLAASLGRVNISADAIIAQANALAAERARSRTKIGLGVCAVVALVTGGITFLAIRSERNLASKNTPAVAQADPPAAATDDPAAAAEDAPTAGSVDDGAVPSDAGTTDKADPAATSRADSIQPDGIAAKDSEPNKAPIAVAVADPPPARPPGEAKQPPPKTAEAPPATVDAGPQPWNGAQQLAGAIRPASESAFADVADETPAMKAADVREWFAGVEGQGHQIQDQRNLVVVKGMARLRAPWPEHAVLRITAENWHNVQFHCWNGADGVTLRHVPNYGSQLSWAGYQTQREGRGPLPQNYALTSSDAGRFTRLPNCRSIDLRYENGCVLLSRGPVPLVSVPLAARPSEIYLQGELDVRRIQMFRSAPLEIPPDVLTDSRPIAAQLRDLGDLSWRKNLPKQATFHDLPNGSVKLAVENVAEVAFAGTRLPSVGVGEVIVEVENASPGTGVYLGDDDGTPVFPVRFVLDQRTKRPAVHFLPITDNQTALGYDWNAMVVPYVGSRVWLRMIYTGAVLKCWVSVDGEHWGQVWAPWGQNVKVPITTVGVFSAPIREPRSITLKQIIVRQFDAINSLAPDKLIDEAPALAGVAEYGAWLAGVTARQPASAATAEWRRAAAIRTLAQGAPTPLAVSLARLLVADGTSSDRSLDQQLRLLDQVATVVNLWDAPGGGVEPLDLGKCYRTIGVQQARRGELRPYRQVGLRSLLAPVWAPQPKEFFQEALARRELLGLAAAGRWEDVRPLGRELAFYNFPGLTPLVQWAEATSAQHLPDNQVREAAVLDFRGRHPLAVELSKEGYNVLAELDAALAGRAFQDACQIISAVRFSNRFGLLPDGKHRDLWVSLGLAVSNAMQRFPELLATMQQQYGALGRLRVQEAITAGDDHTLAAATVQFYGTMAAAQAHEWLGDRDFSRGDFSQALGHYRQAYQNSEGDLRHQVAARARLAQAMLGRSVGQPITSAVRVGDTDIPAAQFEQLIAETLKNHKGATTAAAAPLDAERLATAPPPTGLNLDNAIKMTWALGANPHHIPGPVAQQQIDWVGRQIGWASDRSGVYLSNGFSVCAYEPGQAGFRWNTEIWDNKANTHGWPLVPMRPAVAAGRVVARRPTQQGMGLTCLDAASGKIVWQSEIRGDQEIISDPVIIGSEVAVLASQMFARNMTLIYSAYDLESGELRYQRPIVQYGRSWAEYRTCALATAGDSIVAATGGSVVCLDLEGNTRWIRRQVWLSAAQLPNWIDCQALPPLILKGRVYVVQPGVAAVACLNLASGEALWSRPLIDVHRLIGLVDGRLIVETAEGLMALDAQTGEMLWQHDVTQLLHASLSGDRGPIIYSRRDKVRDRVFRPQLVWLDSDSGQPVASCAFDKFSDAEPMFGPLIAQDGRLLVFAGQGVRTPQREMFTLTPTGAAAPAPVDLVAADRWLPVVPGDSVQLAQQVLPQWTLLNAAREPFTLVEHQGEKNVLQATASPADPIAFAKYLTPGASRKLLIRVANPTDESVRLEAFVGGEVAWEKTISGSETKGAWQQFEVDLAPYVEQSAWIVLAQRHVKGRNPRLVWQKAELQP